MDAVSSLFEAFRRGGTEYLLHVVDEEMPESLHLDFKLLENGSSPMRRGDRKTLAEALSGFANSDGGVIVWGVDCRKQGPLDPDTAKDLKPIRGLGLLLSDLNSHSAQLVSPGIVGVEHSVIEDPGQPDTGFAVTLVPRAEDNLHMAVGADQHRYYYRTTASFLPMEAYMVADRYGRRSRPKLEARFEFVDRDGTGSGPEDGLIYRVSIMNNGKGIALYPAISIRGTHVRPWLYGIDGNMKHTLQLRPRAHSDRREPVYVYAGGSDDAIHADTTMDVSNVVVAIPRSASLEEDIIIRYGLHCDGFTADGEFRITPDEVRGHRAL